MTKAEIEESKQQVRDVVYNVRRHAFKSQNQCAQIMGWTNQQMSDKLRRCSLGANEFLYLLDKLGCKVVYTHQDGYTADRYYEGHGGRIKMFIGDKTYDTKESNSISSSFWEDGKNEFDADGNATELFIDKDGDYFLAKYSKYGAEKEIELVNDEFVKEYVTKYGEMVEREPKKNLV